jgi:acetolactate synthase-1/2/3 large subunit
MRVDLAVGRALAFAGVTHAFGVVGSGNHVTNGLVEAGARFVAARHEGTAAAMADAFSRLSGRAAVLSVIQGPGFTNSLTGITEAAKSRSRVLAIVPVIHDRRSNSFVDQAALATAVGADYEVLKSAPTAVADALRVHARVMRERKTIVLGMPMEILAQECHEPAPAGGATVPLTGDLPPSAEDVARLVGLLGEGRRTVFVAGRGARFSRAKEPLIRLASYSGALLATSAAARGLFRGVDFDLDICGGFSTPLTAELIAGAELIIGWGCSLNSWTTRSGGLIGPSTSVVQGDLDAGAIGLHTPVTWGVVADVGETARVVANQLSANGHPLVGYRTPEVRDRIRAHGSWRQVEFVDESMDGRLDPRVVTMYLNALLPRERVVSIDSGHFMGFASMFLDVPDEYGFCFTQAYMSIGLGLASAIGAALAQPNRLSVAACGDAGFMMSLAELETAVRLKLPMVIVVYNDHAHGVEVHHFGPMGYPLSTVEFSDTDIAAVGRGIGCAAVTIRERGDFADVARWLEGDRDRPLLIDAKITAESQAWWLREVAGH